MRVTTIEHLHQLTWMPRLFPVNCYLVEEEKGLTLIDAAMPFSVKGILETAAGLNKSITRILLTHAHADHVGALDALKKQLPDAVVHISARDAALLRGNRSLLPGEQDTPIKGSVPKKMTTQPDVLLHDGDIVGSLRIINCPGHTPGSIAFQDQRTGAVIAGDAFQIFRGVAVSGTLVPLFPFPAMATWNKELALQSALKLLQAAPTVLAVGHGDMLMSPEHEMERAIRKAQIT